MKGVGRIRFVYATRKTKTPPVQAYRLNCCGPLHDNAGRLAANKNRGNAGVAADEMLNQEEGCARGMAGGDVHASWWLWK